MPSKMWDNVTYPFPNFNGCTVEVWEWISKFIAHFLMDVITYPCWGKNKCMLVKGSQGIHDFRPGNNIIAAHIYVIYVVVLYVFQDIKRGHRTVKFIWRNEMMMPDIYVLLFLLYSNLVSGRNGILNGIRDKVARKSKDSVYGIWVYKVLGIWKSLNFIWTSIELEPNKSHHPCSVTKAPSFG